MSKIIFKTVFTSLCFVVVISAQQAEQNMLQALPQQEVQQPIQQPVQYQQPIMQPVQQPIQPQVQYQQPIVQPIQQPIVQQVQQPVQVQPVQQPQQTNCPKQQSPTSIGLYARFNLNSVSYGFNNKKNDKLDMGIGIGGGAIRRTPITKSIDVNPEIGFFHRNLYSEKIQTSDSTMNLDETEFVLSIIPVLAQVTPFEIPLYVAAGFQVDIPMLAKLAVVTEYSDGTPTWEDTDKFGDRAGYDLGIVLGIGYNITERFSFNFRSVIGLRSITGKSSDARTPTQYGLGVTFF